MAYVWQTFSTLKTVIQLCKCISEIKNNGFLVKQNVNVQLDYNKKCNNYKNLKFSKISCFKTFSKRTFYRNVHRCN